MDTLQNARDHIKANWEDGIDCPCCGQLVKLYRRRLNSNMVRFLISLVRRWESNGGEWVNYLECSFRGRDYNFLGADYFALAVDASTVEDKKSSGLWKPTQRGVDFVYNRITMPSHVHHFDHKRYGFSDTQITITEALGKKFSYQELMNP